MSKLRWGVLGCSSFARRRGIPALLTTPSAKLVAVASRSKEKAEKFRSEFGLARCYGSYEELLDDPDIDAIHITTVNGLHAEWMLKSIEKGKHVLCEKPFTTSVEQAEKVAAAAEGSKTKIMEGLVWRFHPQHKQALKAIEQGEIGDVRLVRAAFTFQLQDPAVAAIRLHPELGGGAMLDIGCYPVSSSRFYFGSEPSLVNVRGYVHAEYGVDVHMAGSMEFPGGVSLIDCGFDAPFRTDLEIVGSTGRIYFPKAWQPPQEATLYLNDEPIVLPATNQYVLMFEHFSTAILQGSSLDWEVTDAVLQMKAIEAIIHSIHSRQPETVQKRQS